MELKKGKIIILLLSINFGFFIRFFCKSKFPFVGISSNQFNEMSLQVMLIAAFFSLSTILYSPYYKILLHPCFLISLSSLSQDIIYVGILCFFLTIFSNIYKNSQNDIYFCNRYIFPFIGLFRHFLISPSPGFSLIWLFESHFYTQFLPISRKTILIFEFL